MHLELREDAVRSVALILIAFIGAGCTTVVVNLPESDGAVADASGDAAADGSEFDASTDASTADADATTLPADATAEADVPDVCVDADNPDCCFNGQPIRVGLLCGDYPDSAEAVCNAVGVCHPQVAQSCWDENLCCDGWRPRWENNNAACHCIVDHDRDHPVTPGPPYLRGCKNEPNDGENNMQGTCRYEYPGNLGGHQEQFTCVSNVTWTP